MVQFWIQTELCPQSARDTQPVLNRFFGAPEVFQSLWRQSRQRQVRILVAWKSCSCHRPVLLHCGSTLTGRSSYRNNCYGYLGCIERLGTTYGVPASGGAVFPFDARLYWAFDPPSHVLTITRASLQANYGQELLKHTPTPHILLSAVGEDKIVVTVTIRSKANE